MSGEEPKDFGAVLEDLILSRGWTDTVLADCLHKDRSTVYRWHSEGRPPDAATLKLIKECLNLNTSETQVFYEAAGYLVVSDRSTKQSEPVPKAQPAAESTVLGVEDEALLATPEPRIIRIQRVDKMTSLPWVRAPFNLRPLLLVAIGLVCLFLYLWALSPPIQIIINNLPGLVPTATHAPTTPIPTIPTFAPSYIMPTEPAHLRTPTATRPP